MHFPCMIETATSKCKVVLVLLPSPVAGVTASTATSAGSRDICGSIDVAAEEQHGCVDDIIDLGPEDIVGKFRFAEEDILDRIGDLAVPVDAICLDTESRKCRFGEGFRLCGSTHENVDG